MRVFLIVLDGVGIGELPDAADYGDEGSSTLPHVAEAVNGLNLPTLQRLGLGNLVDVMGVPPIAGPHGARGRLAEKAAGKDSTSGHWELAGVTLDKPFPTFPDGFVQDLLEAWCAKVGRGWLGNKAASGTAIVNELGEAHQRSGDYIVYTSADSVFQVAAHIETVPLEELYDACRTAREMLQGDTGVGRVIARPFEGRPGDYRRRGDKRRDFSLEPIGPTLLDCMVEAGHNVITVGKVDDLFAGRGITEAIHTKNNTEGEEILAGLARSAGEGLVFANLVDFDQLYGHRNDPGGFAAALEQTDHRLEEILAHLRDDEILMITADHGNDPTTSSTDHSREYTPWLIGGNRVKRDVDLGTRETFADVAATIAELFRVVVPGAGASVLQLIRS